MLIHTQQINNFLQKIRLEICINKIKMHKDGVK